MCWLRIYTGTRWQDRRGPPVNRNRFANFLFINERILTTPQTARSVTASVAEFSISCFCSIPPGELPPPAPRSCFGRDELIEKVVGLAETLDPIALIGAGGIGKTSIALTVLHHSRIKERFGDDRRFIRCDQFPPSRIHLLARLSKVIGAGVENLEDLTPLRPILSSRKMLIILDNVESILDPHGTNTREILAVVDELCQFEMIWPSGCVCMTSRITTVPRCCKRPRIPTLTMEAARDIFYGIYGDDEQSVIVDDLLQRLDFHALSITLLATTASYNTWDYDRLAKEWDTHRAQVLRTDHNESLAATIEVSLDSPTFRRLGPDARGLLGVVAFFPQGVDENNLDWFFPTIPDRKNVFDKFCVLSLTYRNKGFITMLAPIRDYLRPQAPASSPLLCTTRDHYFTRLSGFLDPNTPDFGKARWITSEDMNVEHLLDVFISIDINSGDFWDACMHFMDHLYWYKSRRVVLAPKIKALPDNHHSKPGSLFYLSRLFERIGGRAEQKQLLNHSLDLERRRGNDGRVAVTLRWLSDLNRLLQLHEEGIQQAREASEICGRIGDTVEQAGCLKNLALCLLDNKQLDAAEAAACRALDIIPEKGQEHLFCQTNRTLGRIYHSKGEKEKAIHHFRTALRIASPFNWHDTLFWNNYCLAELFRSESDFDDANIHVEHAKSHTSSNPYFLGRAMQMQAKIWHKQGQLGKAKSEALCALEIFEKVGAARDAGVCKDLLQQLDGE